MPRTYESQIVDQNFSAGVDEFTDKRYNNSPDVLLNCRFDRPPAVEKRFGTDQITREFTDADIPETVNGGGPSSGLFSINNELFFARNGYCYKVVDEPDAAGLHPTNIRGALSRLDVKLVPSVPQAARTVAFARNVDAIGGEVLLVGYSAVGGTAFVGGDGTNVYMLQLVDRTGGFRGAPRLLAEDPTPTFPPAGGNKMVIVPNLTTGNFYVGYSFGVADIVVQMINGTTLATMATVTVTTAALNPTGFSSGEFDMSFNESTGRLGVVFANNTASNQVSVWSATAALTGPITSTYGGANTNIGNVAIHAMSDGNFAFQYSHVVGTTLFEAYRYKINGTTHAPIVGPTLMYSWTSPAPGQKFYGGIGEATNPARAGEWHVFSTPEGALAQRYTAAGVLALSVNMNGLIPLTAPYELRGKMYATMAVSTWNNGVRPTSIVEVSQGVVVDLQGPQQPDMLPSLQASFANLEIAVTTAHGLLAPGRGTVKVYVAGDGANIYETALSALMIGGINRLSEEERAAPFPFQINLLGLSTNIGSLSFADSADNSTGLISGGQVYQVDKQRCFPLGFPDVPCIFLNGAFAGGAVDLGIHFYAVVYRLTDSYGNQLLSQQSASTSITITTAGTQSVGIRVSRPTFFSYHASHEGSADPPGYRCEILVYRTVAGGATPYLVASIVWVPDATPGGLYPGSSFAFNDLMSDAQARDNSSIYTIGGIKEYQNPPGARNVFQSANRMWLVGTPNGRIYFSGVAVEASAWRFNADFTLPLFGSGDAVAGSDLDGVPVIFRENEIWFVLGEGPDDTGVGFFTMKRIVSDVGCDSAQSLVQTPWGIEFQYKANLYILTRDGKVQRIGDGVVGSWQKGKVANAVNLPDMNEVRFLIRDTSPPLAVVQDVNISTPQKPVFYNYEYAYGGKVVGTPTGSCLWQGDYVFQTTRGQIFRENTAHHLDKYVELVTSNWVPMRVVASWSRTGLMGFTRQWKSGVIYDTLTNDADFTLKIYNAYTDTPTQTKTFASGVASLANDRRAMLRLVKQRGYSYRLEFVDSMSSTSTLGTGKGFRLAGVSHEIQVQGGVTRLPKGQKG